MDIPVNDLEVVSNTGAVRDVASVFWHDGILCAVIIADTPERELYVAAIDGTRLSLRKKSK